MELEAKRRKEGKEEKERPPQGGRKEKMRARTREREAERDSERRQRPFFDKLVTRRHPAAKGAEGSSGTRRQEARRQEVELAEGRSRGRGRSEGCGTGGKVGYAAGVGFYGDQ